MRKLNIFTPKADNRGTSRELQAEHRNESSGSPPLNVPQKPCSLLLVYLPGHLNCWKVKCCFSLCEASPPPQSFPQRGRGTEQSSTIGIAMATWRTRGHQGLRSSTPRISGLVSLGRGQTPSCSQLRQLPQTHAVQLSAQRCLERVWLWTIFS